MPSTLVSPLDWLVTGSFTNSLTLYGVWVSLTIDVTRGRNSMGEILSMYAEVRPKVRLSNWWAALPKNSMKESPGCCPVAI